jgi:hypothetical protein
MFFSLSSVLLPHFPVPCLMSYVSCLKCQFLFSHPLFPVSRLCSLFPVYCSLSHVSVPCFPSSVLCLTSLFFISRPLSPILCFMSYFVPCLPSSVQCLNSLHPDPEPDPLVRGRVDPRFRIQIHTKESWIRSTAIRHRHGLSLIIHSVPNRQSP